VHIGVNLSIATFLMHERPVRIQDVNRYGAAVVYRKLPARPGDLFRRFA
jgi:hypothetical protein